MSYSTWVEFDFQGDEIVPRESVLACARNHLEAAKCYAVDAILEDFRKSLDENGARFAVYPDDVDLMAKAIASHFPKLTVGFRAVGEEFHDVWLRIYSGESVPFYSRPF